MYKIHIKYYIQFIVIILLISISDFAMVAKLTKDPKPRKLKDGKEEKQLSPVTRSGIKQALRVKCNSVICNLRKKLCIIMLALPLNWFFIRKYNIAKLLMVKKSIVLGIIVLKQFVTSEISLFKKNSVCY